MSEAATPQPKWLYSIVVAGAIDPRQHVPHWYRTIGLLSDEEFAHAMKTLQMGDGKVQFIGPKGAFVILCNANQWQISTDGTSDLARQKIVDIAALVFDKLYETFFLAFGVNTHATLPTKVPHVGFALRSALGGFLPPANSPDMHFITADHQPDGTTVTIQLMQGEAAPNFLSVGYGVHHPTKGMGQFDFGEVLRRHCKRDWQQGEAFAKASVLRVESLGVKRAN
jgi:hypothetical protein